MRQLKVTFIALIIYLFHSSCYAEVFCMTDQLNKIKTCSDGSTYNLEGQVIESGTSNNAVKKNNWEDLSQQREKDKKRFELDRGLSCQNTYNKETHRMDNKCTRINCQDVFEDGQWRKVCN